MDPGLVKSMIVQALREGRRARLRFCGLSMSPLLMPGDEIAVEPLPGPPEKGDIVLFQAYGEFVAHRVIKAGSATRPSIRVKGDAVGFGFEELPPGKVLGLVSARFRGSGRLDFRTGPMRQAGRLMALLSPHAPGVLSAAPRPARRLVRGLFELFLRLLG